VSRTEARLTGLSSVLVLLKDHSLITKARLLALSTLFTFDSNIPFVSGLVCIGDGYSSSNEAISPGCNTESLGPLLRSKNLCIGSYFNMKC
jgi:hypothetical protein